MLLHARAPRARLLLRRMLLLAVSEPFLGRKWWEIGVLGCRKAIFGASRLKTSPSYVQTD
jgi:hypothetical protein